MFDSKKISRRDFNLLSRNLFLGCMAAPFARYASAESLSAFTVGHFNSANPQTYSKIHQTFERALAGRATVRYANMQSAPEFLAAMTSGSLDTCSIGSSPFVTGAAQQLDISMVYIQKVITNSEALVVRRDKGIDSLAALRGKKIGLPFNTSAHFAMLGVLKKAGLGVQDVQLLNLKPDALMASWASGSLDAAYIWHPFLKQMADDQGKILISTSDLREQGLLVFDAIVVRNQFKRENPELLLAYLQSYAQLCRQFNAGQAKVVDDFTQYLRLPRETAFQYVSTFNTLSAPEIISEQWMGKPGQTGTGVLSSLAAQAQFLKEARQISAVPADFSPFVDSSFAVQVAESEAIS